MHHPRVRLRLTRTIACLCLLGVPLLAQGPTIQLPEATIAELRAAMQSGLLTAEGLAIRYQARVSAYDQVGPHLNAILTLNPNLLDEARQRDRDAQLHGARGPLFGIPVLLKDNIDALPMATTAGSVALAGSVPPDDSFIAQRLRAAGAVVFGKATLTEFANFMSTGGMPNGYSSLGGSGANPYDPRRAPNGLPIADTGGSSSGSGIAVAANLVSVAIGSETSGSILSPSSSNGVVGIKPTVGLISRDGMLPITADQDTAGPMARTVADAATLLGVIAGYDPNDPATIACQTPGNCFSDYTQFLDRSALQAARIAVPVPQFGLDPEQARIMRAATGTLRAAGAFVVDPHGMPPPFLGPICVSYPPPVGESTVLIFGMKRDLNHYLAGLGPGAPRQSLTQIIAYNIAHASTALRYGQLILISADQFNTTPGSANELRYLADRQQDLTISRSALDAVFNGPDGLRGTADDFDAIMFPANFGADAPARAGYPSICVPGGLMSNGLPFGVTLSGRAFSESRLIALAYAFEQATGYRAPPASAPALPTDRIPLNLASVRTLGNGCLGSNGVPTIATGGPPILANSAFRIAFGALRPNAPTLIALAQSAHAVLLGPCLVYPAQPFLFVTGGVSDASGAVTFNLGIPWVPAISGATLFVQGGAIDPPANAAGVALSGALQITIGG